MDWERVIPEGLRTLDYLKDTVRSIYRAIRETEALVEKHFHIATTLPKRSLLFILKISCSVYPGMTDKQRENAICKE